MAINYPGFVVPKGYDKPDIYGEFAKGYGLTKGIKDEGEAAELLKQYAGTLYGAPTSQAAVRPTSPAAYADQLVGGSHAAAEGAADPLLTAFLSNTRRAESGGNDNAKNPNSSATGRYQFLEGTWADLAARHPDLGLTPDGRLDPNQQERAMRVFTAENARALKGSGVPVTPGALYAAHFLGADGAPKVLNGDPNAPVSAYVDPEVMQANPHLADMTIADFKAWADKQGGNGSGGYQAPTLAQPTAAPAGARLPPREVMAQLLANPVTRPMAIDLIKAQQDGSSDMPSNVQEWEYFSKLPPEQQSQYLVMKRSAPFLDRGTEFARPDPLTGQIGPTVTKENYQEAFDTSSGNAAGKATTEGALEAPAAIASAENSIAQIDAVINDPNLKYAIGVGGLLPAIPGTPQAGTIARIEQLQGAAFLQAFESLKGGGQITEVEGKKATDAIARLSRAQNDTDFKQALEDLKSVINIGLDRAKSRLARPAGAGQATNLPKGVTEDDIQTTMEIHGLSREQVLERLNGGT